MKRFILVLFLVSFGFLFKPGAQAASLQLNITATPAASAAAPKVEYFLPYPGILPDHLLYPLKTLRDKIMGFLLKDTLKKAEFELLTADKRLGAGKVLMEGGKPELGETTFSKAEKYLETAILNLEKAKNEGKKTEEALTRMEKAIRKHIEILEEVLLKAPEQAKPGLENALEKAQKGYQKALELKKNK